MHAIVVDRLGDASVLEWREKEEPLPGPGEVTIRVSTTSVNFADIMRRRGGYRGGPPPFTPGLDCTGTIVAVGEGVRELHAGQRVAAFPIDGAYAEIVRARAVLTYPLDPAIPEEAAASLTVLVTAHNLLAMVARLRDGESILIHAAAGGVGSTAVQMARALGAARIIGTAGGAEKTKIARDAGADVVIDYTGEDLGARVRAETANKGVDVVLDAVAGDVFTQSLPLVAPFGRYCIYGMASGKPGEAKSNELHNSNRAVLGYSTGGYREARPEGLREGVSSAFALVKSGAVKILVGARYALREAAEAHRLVESRASHGKVLLTP
jgi:NADPH2:quinone reductase